VHLVGFTIEIYHDARSLNVKSGFKSMPLWKCVLYQLYCPSFARRNVQ